MAFISYTERPISALGLAGEAGAGLTWVDFNLGMPQETPIRWALNSWGAQANQGHPNNHFIGRRYDLYLTICTVIQKTLFEPLLCGSQYKTRQKK